MITEYSKLVEADSYDSLFDGGYPAEITPWKERMDKIMCPSVVRATYNALKKGNLFPDSCINFLSIGSNIPTQELFLFYHICREPIIYAQFTCIDKLSFSPDIVDKFYVKAEKGLFTFRDLTEDDRYLLRNKPFNVIWLMKSALWNDLRELSLKADMDWRDLTKDFECVEHRLRKYFLSLNKGGIIVLDMPVRDPILEQNDGLKYYTGEMLLRFRRELWLDDFFYVHEDVGEGRSRVLVLKKK